MTSLVEKISAAARHLKAPRFWDKPSLAGRLLAPLGYGYLGACAVHQALITPQRANLPVVAVGNVTLGGAGKTPVALSLARMLQAAGEMPHILSRGYGAELREPLRVDPSLHSALMVGDEPLLLARAAPTWVYPERALAARLAADAGASLVLLDDGLQHHALLKDISLLVVDTSYHLGNGRMFPAGPLREPFEAAVERAQAIIALGPDPLRVALPFVRPVFRALLNPTTGWAALKSRPVIAFAGIARPEKFFAMAERHGIAVLERHPYPDHYVYTRDDFAQLKERSRLMGAPLITTEKDAVKLHPDDAAQVTVLAVEVLWQDEPGITGFIGESVTQARARLAG